MRSIVILFLTISVVALALRLLPERSAGAEGSAPEAAASESDEATQGEGDGFLAPPPAARVEPPPVVRDVAAVAEEPAEVRTQMADLRDTPDVAGALLHSEPRELSRFLASSHPELASERRRFLEAFSNAIAGRYEEATAAAEARPGNACSAAELALLREALSKPSGRTSAASHGRPGSVELAMEIALLRREGEALLALREWARASKALSEVLLADLRAGWRSSPAFTESVGQALNEAQRNNRWAPGASWPSLTLEVQPGDSLSTIRKRAIERVPGLLVCTGLIAEVNGIGDRYLQAGEKLRIPVDPVSTLVDLEARALLYSFGGEVAAYWKVAIGAAESETPAGSYTVGELIEEPPWFRRGEAAIPYGDPKNELGTRWIGWLAADGTPTHFGFHGTWEPEKIGQAVSDGCIRMRNSDVERLFRTLPRGTPIRVQL